MPLSEHIHKEAGIGRIRDHIRALQGVRHPVAAPEALERAADYLHHSLAAMAYDMEEQRFTEGTGEYRNIIATRTGIGLPEERVCVIAHYDTVEGSPGADDNASGCAALLEMARLMQDITFERTVQFIGVCLEENQRTGDHGSGLRGSSALAAHARANGWDIKGALVLESVAYAGADVVQSAPAGVPLAVPETGNFIAVVGNERSAAMVQGFCNAAGRLVPDLAVVPLVVPGNGEMLPDTRRSDHAPFWDQGYPAVMVTDTTNFRNPHYHQPTDTLETLNLEFCAAVCHAACGLVMELAGSQGV